MARRSDGHLWMIALGLSLLANAALVVFFGFAVLESAVLRRAQRPPEPPPAESFATIVAELAPPATPTPTTPASEAPPPLESPRLLEKRFVRTSSDQAPPSEKKSSLFIGERDTQATSDRPPVVGAPPLPSQAGVAPKNDEIETTESRYQDGKLAGASELRPDPTPEAVAPKSTNIDESPVKPVEPKPEMVRKTDRPANDATASVPPEREKLLDGPNPVEVEVAKPVERKPITPATTEQRVTTDAVPPEPVKPHVDEPKPTPTKKPTPPTDPAFKGFQRKTAVVGSISRTGRSALEVEDSALGRYQAAISRAVELEFQRNCVRHRDYITPGFLTVRFFVEPGGKVRSVSFDGEMSTGEIQKGFTLNSIRDAEIPPMPQSLRKDYAKDPLELIFRFYF